MSIEISLILNIKISFCNQNEIQLIIVGMLWESFAYHSGTRCNIVNYTIIINRREFITEPSNKLYLEREIQMRNEN